jgi:hypothetical protein
MAFASTFKLQLADGTPADPPTLTTRHGPVLGGRRVARRLGRLDRRGAGAAVRGPRADRRSRTRMAEEGRRKEGEARAQPGDDCRGD